jgi:hypothetical protein
MTCEQKILTGEIEFGADLTSLLNCTPFGFRHYHYPDNPRAPFVLALLAPSLEAGFLLGDILTDAGNNRQGLTKPHLIHIAALVC